VAAGVPRDRAAPQRLERLARLRAAQGRELGHVEALVARLLPDLQLNAGRVEKVEHLLVVDLHEGDLNGRLAVTLGAPLQQHPKDKLHRAGQDALTADLGAPRVVDELSTRIWQATARVYHLVVRQLSHAVGWTKHGVRFPRACLAIGEHGGRVPLDRLLH